MPLQPSTPDAVISKADAFSLHSRPNAAKKILLDFDGHTTTGTAWNADKGMPTITSRPYDKVSTPAAVRNTIPHMMHVSCTCRSLLLGTWSHVAVYSCAPAAGVYLSLSEFIVNCMAV